MGKGNCKRGKKIEGGSQTQMFKEILVLGNITFENCIPRIQSFKIMQDTLSLEMFLCLQRWKSLFLSHEIS